MCKTALSEQHPLVSGKKACSDTHASTFSKKKMETLKLKFLN